MALLLLLASAASALPSLIDLAVAAAAFSYSLSPSLELPALLPPFFSLHDPPPYSGFLIHAAMICVMGLNQSIMAPKSQGSIVGVW